MLLDELRLINVVIFPDWFQENLEIELTEMIGNLFHASHPEQWCLLVDVQGLDENAQEEANLLLGGILFGLLEADEQDSGVQDSGVQDSEIKDLGIIFLDESDFLEWDEIRSLLSHRISFSAEDSIKSQSSGLPSVRLCDWLDPNIQKHLFLSSCLQWGNFWLDRHSYSKAIEFYHQYLEQDYNNSDIYLKINVAWVQLQEIQKALDILTQGIVHCPDTQELYYWQIIRLKQLQDYPAALTQARQSSDRFPENYVFKILNYLLLPEVYDSPEQISTYRSQVEQGLQKLIETIDRNLEKEKISIVHAIRGHTNFFLAYQAQNDVLFQSTYGDLIHRVMSICYPQWTQALSMPTIQPDRPLRIGYVSSFLRAWSGTFLFLNWLKYANRNKFEIYAYFTGTQGDVVTDLFQNYSDRFYHFPKNLEGVAQQIRKDDLHGLIFPELGMDSETLCLAGLRLAPVQCMAWGHPVTSGLSTIDYFLSSELMEPWEGQDHYREKLVRLPFVGISYPQQKLVIAEKKKRADFGLRAEAIVYITTQAGYKYLPQYDDLYAEIARQVPNCQIMFLRSGIPLDRLQKAFDRVQLNSADYCVFSPVLPRSEYFNLLTLCDVYLDTPDWAGGNTTLDAIVAHLPILTWPGDLMRSRHSYGFLQTIGLTETIAFNKVEYLEIAVELGRNSSWRSSLQQKMKNNPRIYTQLFENPQCAASLEQFLTQTIYDRAINLRQDDRSSR